MQLDELNQVLEIILQVLGIISLILLLGFTTFLFLMLSKINKSIEETKEYISEKKALTADISDELRYQTEYAVKKTALKGLIGLIKVIKR